MKNQLIGLVAGFLICTATVMADTFPNTLWIGNDGTAAAPILNTTTTGVVLRQINSTAAVGLAIDSNKLYVNSLSGGNFYNLDSLRRTQAIRSPCRSQLRPDILRRVPLGGELLVPSIRSIRHDSYRRFAVGFTLV